MNTRFTRMGAALALVFAVAAPAYAAAIPSGQITGLINDALGHPIAAARVALQSPDGHSLGTTQTDAPGASVSARLAPGIYAVVVDKANFQTGTDIVTLTAETGHASTITLASTATLDSAR